MDAAPSHVATTRRPSVPGEILEIFMKLSIPSQSRTNKPRRRRSGSDSGSAPLLNLTSGATRLGGLGRPSRRSILADFAPLEHEIRRGLHAHLPARVARQVLSLEHDVAVLFQGDAGIARLDD